MSFKIHTSKKSYVFKQYITSSPEGKEIKDEFTNYFLFFSTQKIPVPADWPENPRTYGIPRYFFDVTALSIEKRGVF